MLFGFLVVVFVIVCILLCFLILIQSDKGGGISGALGGGLGGANSLLGAQDTANILTRGTAIFGGVFLTLCVLMSFTFNRQADTGKNSLLQKRAEKQKELSPAAALGGNALEMKQETGALPAAPTAPVAPALPVAPQQSNNK